MDAVPLFDADDVMYIMPSTPLMASSRGTMTLFCTVSALAPVYEAITRTVGGAISGNCSSARRLSPMMPISTISTLMTPDNIGRSMKVLTFMAYFTSIPSFSRPAPSAMMVSPTCRPSSTIYSLPLFCGNRVTAVAFVLPSTTR